MKEFRLMGLNLKKVKKKVNINLADFFRLIFRAIYRHVINISQFKMITDQK